MVNWRELGEVPDSEDEDGFDSQDHGALAAKEPALQTKQAPGDQVQEKDVWDIPSSQEEGPVRQPRSTKQPPAKSPAPPPRPNPTQQSLTSSPLSTLSSSQGLPPLELLAGNGSIGGPRGRAGEEVERPKTPQDDISPSLVEITSPTPEFLGAVDVTESLPRPRTGPTQTPLQSQILGHDAEQEEARRVAARYERSLRARRPEQMRPYFTEAARFNNEWKQHGLRPLRFATEEDVARREREQSNEPDFEPESQGSNAQLQTTEESQLNDSNEFMDGLFITGASSSPPKTSPLKHRGGPSSQMSSQADTDNTSLDWDELPSLEELARRRPVISATKSSAKRKQSPSRSAARKRRRTLNPLDDSSPGLPTTFIRPPDSPDPLQSPFNETNEDSTPVPATKRRPHQVESDGEATPVSRRDISPSRPTAFTIDSESDNENAGDHSLEAQSDKDATESESGSDSGSEIVNFNSRRIRGVLPASWLRLDQQSGRNKVQKNMHHRHRESTPEHEHRRGVAQRRQAVATAVTDPFLFDESEEEGPVSRIQETTDDAFYHQTRLALEPMPRTGAPEVFSDDGGSVIEDDTIDRMLPGRKRQLKLSDSFKTAAKRPKTTGINRVPSVKTPRQPTITAAFSRPSNSKPASRKPAKKQTKRSHKAGQRTNKGATRKATTKKHYKPPHLSILDVIEPEAPQFLKIAARTAKKRQNQGRDSPSKKSIQLATRWDHVDAISVLSDWKHGSIKQRPSVTAARKAKQPQPRAQPLAERSTNAPPKATSLVTKGGTRKLTKHVSNGGRVSYKTQDQREPSNAVRSHPRGGEKQVPQFARPAMLETEDQERTAAFHARKKFLDRLYRARHGSSTIAGSVITDARIDNEISIPPVQHRIAETTEIDAAGHSPQQSARRRARKRSKPQRIDVEAPQFSHANDPLPKEYSPVQDVRPVHRENETVQLLGLGPYGTRYTHHFEIFPLCTGVYFHESTLLGGGSLERAIADGYCDKMSESKPRASLVLGEQTLRWGPWTSQVSSEVGVVLDFIADQLERNPSQQSPAPNPIDAAAFLLSYVQDSLSFDGEAEGKPLIARLLEAVQGFKNRVLALLESGALDQTLEEVVRVFDRLILVTLLALRICRNYPSMMSDQLQLESLLESMASTLMKALTRVGLQPVRSYYRDLNDARFRERGLRNDAPVIHSWALLLRVLESARIPRVSFWDVMQKVMVNPQIKSSVNAQDHERLWENMFTLLPLVEFNDTGVLVPGRRHRTTTDGWGLPQTLLKRVFELYRENTRQSPSFNNYCRALVGRCHYLVQQWGWRKSSSVVGVIFDFFGSQNLAHLRNEEFYNSPSFLEHLAQSPSLEIESEDKCFHIFLKLIALSILKLREDGSTKVIRNFVARTVPNHNRQYLKEQKIHERDLAALRNHHDLLCTLFWAAPAELRPNVALIEGLVVPASSHKEACLINLRAWNQLVRYLVSTGEVTTALRPFCQWRDTFFQQMMQQYDSVAADIEQQFLGLSKDVSKSISPDMISAMVAMNKTAVMDILYFSVSASLDVMRHAPDLETASFALNTLQLQRVFKHFSAPPPELDWAILRASLATLDVYLSRIDEFKENEESQQSESQILNSAQADDALIVLNHDLAPSFFSMARAVLSPRCNRESNAASAVDKANCIERVVMLAARMGMRFINAGVMTLSDMFRYGKHGLFEDVPHKLTLDHRRYLSLFISTLLRYGFDEFSDAGFTLSELWMLSIVKPRESLAYENKLAEQLIRHQKEFVPEAALGLAVSPDYGMNRDLFEFAISSMRKSIRDAGPSLKKILLAEHSRTLKLVMEQVKGDLKLVSTDLTEHPSYVSFVRDIISLIRAHGSDICTVDDFFYQISKEYSPSMQDPQLQVAGMVSYGLRLAEGDTRVAHQLFFFLFNNLKLAVINDKLGGEIAMLEKGMKNPGIFDFVLGKMLPAAIRASVVETSACLLFDVYAQACHLVLANDVVPLELSEANLSQLIITLRAMVSGMQEIGQGGHLLAEELYMAGQFLGLMNIFWPFLWALSCSGSASARWEELKALLGQCKNFTIAAENYLQDVVDMGHEVLDADVLFGALRRQLIQANNADPHTTSFTDNIIDDVRKNWIASGDRVTIQAPGKARGTQSTQSGQGTERPRFEMSELVAELYERIRVWNEWWDRVFGLPKRLEFTAMAPPVF